MKLFLRKPLIPIISDSPVMKKNYLHSQRKEVRRRRRERYLIAVLLVVISFLTYLGVRVFNLGLELPFSSSILVFALININVILLLLLLFLTGRNLVKLLFERRKNIMGAKLRTKLVLAFMTLSLLPTIILFFVSVQFISLSIEYWFNLPIEQSLKNSVEMGRDYYKGIADEILSLGNNLSRVITHEGYMLFQGKKVLKNLSMTNRRNTTWLPYRSFRTNWNREQLPRTIGLISVVLKGRVRKP